MSLTSIDLFVVAWRVIGSLLLADCKGQSKPNFKGRIFKGRI